MSWFEKTKFSSSMCSRFSSEPVSRLSMQSTRWPLPSRCSHRCEPRNPAPPVTTLVIMAGRGYLRPSTPAEGHFQRPLIAARLHRRPSEAQADLPLVLQPLDAPPVDVDPLPL